MTSRTVLVSFIAAGAVLAFSLLLVVSFTRHHHPLVGAWLAKDRTVFLFRDDGTFIGRDFRDRHIWGSWVQIDERTIGFQSLLHKSYYAPQFAVRTVGGMNYAYSDREGFIPATSISTDEAMHRIAEAIPLPASGKGE